MLTTVRLPAAADTRVLGQALAGLLRAGDLVVLTGPLGAGKTVLAQGIGLGLRVTGPVTSPTFVIARVHRGGRLPLVHVDAYRLGSVAEVDDLDLDAALDDSVTVVEWGAGLVDQLADDHLEVRLSREPGDDPPDPADPPGQADGTGPVGPAGPAGGAADPPGHADGTGEIRLAEIVPVGDGWVARLAGLPELLHRLDLQ
ncbi:MAG: tRNA threonylcarbamoyladenosine biosynthesis protein TsaE [Mycobacteriales bacterium]|jgi:tRNA threonylcarbamoyladenosine biosynthesis protein TsaE